uniref:Secreted protein n=1 Tax=Heterorhabditis bacteriophora TaxID=37862 RepID=A0A1I7XMF6_HETBA
MKSLFSLLIVCGICSSTKFYSTPKWECDGGVEFDKAPIIFYFNSSETLCFAARKGCTPSSITTVYDTMEECLTKEFPS